MEQQISLFGVKLPETKLKEKKNGVITISESTFKTDIPERDIKNGDRGTSFHFDGYQEGYATMYSDKELIADGGEEKIIKGIIESYKRDYDYTIKIKDERIKQEIFTAPVTPAIDIEKEIKIYSEKLKELLKIKYGCEVTLRVLK